MSNRLSSPARKRLCEPPPYWAEAPFSFRDRGRQIAPAATSVGSMSRSPSPMTRILLSELSPHQMEAPFSFRDREQRNVPDACRMSDTPSSPPRKRLRESSPYRMEAPFSFRDREQHDVPATKPSSAIGKAQLEGIVKGLPIAAAREVLWTASRYPDVTQNIAGDRPTYYFTLKEDYEAQFKKIGAAAVRGILLESALAHEDVQEHIMVEAPGDLLAKCSLGGDDRTAVCTQFRHRAEHLVGSKYALEKFRRGSEEKIAAKVAREIEGMLDAMFKWASANTASFETKDVCLRTTTAILEYCLSSHECLMGGCLKADHMPRWSRRVRAILETLSVAELKRLRSNRYEWALLALWTSAIDYDPTDDIPGFASAQMVFRNPPNWKPPPPEPPKYWPQFGKDTVKYFADRTGGWGKDWGYEPSGLLDAGRKRFCDF